MKCLSETYDALLIFRMNESRLPIQHTGMLNNRTQAHLHMKRMHAAATSGCLTSAAPATQQPTSGTLYAAASLAASGTRLRPRSMVSRPSCVQGQQRR